MHNITTSYPRTRASSKLSISLMTSSTGFLPRQYVPTLPKALTFGVYHLHPCRRARERRINEIA